MLLELLVADHPASGIHYETARTTCSIIAGNCWDGYFIETTQSPRLDLESDSLLLKSEYYF